LEAGRPELWAPPEAVYETQYAGWDDRKYAEAMSLDPFISFLQMILVSNILNIDLALESSMDEECDALVEWFITPLMQEYKKNSAIGQIRDGGVLFRIRWEIFENIKNPVNGKFYSVIACPTELIPLDWYDVRLDLNELRQIVKVWYKNEALEEDEYLLIAEPCPPISRNTIIEPCPYRVARDHWKKLRALRDVIVRAVHYESGGWIGRCPAVRNPDGTINEAETRRNKVLLEQAMESLSLAQMCTLPNDMMLDNTGNPTNTRAWDIEPKASPVSSKELLPTIESLKEEISMAFGIPYRLISDNQLGTYGSLMSLSKMLYRTIQAKINPIITGLNDRLIPLIIAKNLGIERPLPYYYPINENIEQRKANEELARKWALTDTDVSPTKEIDKELLMKEAGIPLRNKPSPEELTEKTPREIEEERRPVRIILNAKHRHEKAPVAILGANKPVDRVKQRIVKALSKLREEESRELYETLVRSEDKAKDKLLRILEEGDIASIKELQMNYADDIEQSLRGLIEGAFAFGLEDYLSSVGINEVPPTPKALTSKFTALRKMKAEEIANEYVKIAQERMLASWDYTGRITRSPDVIIGDIRQRWASYREKNIPKIIGDITNMAFNDGRRFGIVYMIKTRKASGNV